jgi:hypothetical protein
MLTCSLLGDKQVLYGEISGLQIMGGCGALLIIQRVSWKGAVSCPKGPQTSWRTLDVESGNGVGGRGQPGASLIWGLVSMLVASLECPATSQGEWCLWGMGRVDDMESDMGFSVGVFGVRKPQSYPLGWVTSRPVT